MRLATIRHEGRELAAVLHERRLYRMEWLNDRFDLGMPTELFALLAEGRLDPLRQWYDRDGSRQLRESAEEGVPVEAARFGPLYRHPRKIWGIGLNYREHASDLDETSPTLEPASFMKPDTTIIGPGDTIEIPELSRRVTGEGELGLVFGRRCRAVARSDWREVLAGFVTIVDMTAEDILRRNPRNLTQSKSFDTFFSFGPVLVTVDEVAEVTDLRVRTIHNGKVHAENAVSNMTFPPDFLVAYHSRIMTMLPGDVIATGTPGAAVLADGDTVGCEIDGFEPLENPVRDLAMSKEGS